MIRKKMLKKIMSIVLVVVLTFSFTGCGASSGTDGGENAEAQAETVTFTDMGGNEVTVPVNPERIAVCNILPLPSILAVFFDSAERIVGMPETSLSAAENGLLGELYPELMDVETGYIKDTDVNVEELMKLEPDVVFYSNLTPQVGEQLKNAGFCAVAVSANSWGYDCIETFKEWIAMLSKIFPENDRVEIVEEYSSRIYDMVRERVSAVPDSERKNIFFLYKYSETDLMTSGRNFFGNWWAEASGAKNAAAELTRDNQVSAAMEQIYKWDPDMIFITNFTEAQPEDLYENTVGNYDWSGLSAVKDKQVYKMPLGMYRSYTPGADTPVTLLWFAKTIYPDRFEDIDIIGYAVDYYKTVFGIELTEEQAESIFKPAGSAAAGF